MCIRLTFIFINTIKTTNVMKRMNWLLGACVMALTLVCGTGTSAFAQSKKDIKSAEKTAKKVAKERAKEGWTLVGIGSMEDAIADGILKQKEGYRVFTSEVSGHSSKSSAIADARMEAMIAYVTETSNELNGLMGNVQSGIPEAVVRQLSRDYTSAVQAGIYGQLREAYTLIRKVGNYYEVQANFLLNESDAFEMKQRALRQAIATANLNKEVAQALEESLAKSSSVGNKEEDGQNDAE